MKTEKKDKASLLNMYAEGCSKVGKYDDGTKGAKTSAVKPKSKTKDEDYAERRKRFSENLKKASPETKADAAVKLAKSLGKTYADGTGGTKVSKDDLSKDDAATLATKKRNAQAVASGRVDGGKTDTGVATAASRSSMGGDYTKQEKRALEAQNRVKEIDQEAARRTGSKKYESGTAGVELMKRAESMSNKELLGLIKSVREKEKAGSTSAKGLLSQLVKHAKSKGAI